MAWDYTDKQYQKQKQKDPVWGLERQINYGLGKKKIDKGLLAKHINKLHIPKNRKSFLKLLLWGKTF